LPVLHVPTIFSGLQIASALAKTLMFIFKNKQAPPEFPENILPMYDEETFTRGDPIFVRARRRWQLTCFSVMVC
jgi:hypothetical protein